MGNFIKDNSDVWGDNPRKLLDDYTYQKNLTPQLDDIDVESFDRKVFYEIVLWKLNRFPLVSDELIFSLKEIRDIRPGQHREAEEILRELLGSSGIRLPMASTILRFLNRSTFQIIDDRAYRFLCPGEKTYPAKPIKITEGYLKNSIDIYFSYLDKLRETCCKELPFEFADRILYLADKKRNNKIGD